MKLPEPGADTLSALAVVQVDEIGSDRFKYNHFIS